MTNWNDLLAKALDIAQDAQVYLDKRQTIGTANASEAALLNSLTQEIGNVVDMLRSTANAGVVLKDPTLNIFSEQLDLSQKHIHRLDSFSDYIDVESVVGGLKRQLQVMAGPHGPGEAPPAEADLYESKEAPPEEGSSAEQGTGATV